VLTHVARAVHLPRVADLLSDPFGNGAVGQVLTAGGIVLGFVVMLKVFTHQKVHTRFTFIGAGLFYLLFQAAHAIYDQYIERITNVGAMYGSFATLIIVVLWIYYTATLLLICCHVVKTVQRRVLHGPRWPKDKLTLW
jgi:uncharacterized BrkB/YihY/UPF0761 family membrane protein